MNINKEVIEPIVGKYGEAFYILDTEQIKINYTELLNAFRKYYRNTYISYSYKTNYTPEICKIIDELGGYAEVVSQMEMEIARRLGIDYEKIIFNGPYKDPDAVRTLLLNGGIVNIDSLYDYKIVEENEND